MRQVAEPLLQPIEITALRPTQMTIGMREVHQKRAEWQGIPEEERPQYLGRHMLPAVIGPKGKHYIIDNHHLARALHEEGVPKVLVSIVADLHRLERSTFWTFLDSRNWMHPFNEDGERQSYAELPKTIDKLADDPYRSLAGALREAGGFAKDNTPYSEFLWADFLRRGIRKKALAADFEGSLKKAIGLARGQAANYLPGWCGPEKEDKPTPK